jgi:hypothetical protein
VFEEFRLKQFQLLWRGSRDGFQSSVFHRLCDGHANTLTIILDNNGNIFGGFAAVPWQRNQKLTPNIPDPSNRGFLFTLQNPVGIPPMLFPLKPDLKDYALYYDSNAGPCFGGVGTDKPCDIHVLPEMIYQSNFGNYYRGYQNSGSKLSPEFFPAEMDQCSLTEIEVFEIIG